MVNLVSKGDSLLEDDYKEAILSLYLVKGTSFNFFLNFALKLDEYASRGTI